MKTQILSSVVSFNGAYFPYTHELLLEILFMMLVIAVFMNKHTTANGRFSI